VLLDDELRRRLLDARDEVARIVEEGEDPGPASSCSESCPWGWACRENPVRV
jgi:CRISPR-associated protein Csa1